MSKDKTLNDLIVGYQTRLQGVANDLAVRLAAIIEKTDPKLLKLMTAELTPKESESIVQRIQRLEKVLKALEAVREPAYKTAGDVLFETSAGVASLATKQVQREIAVARADLRKARFDATLGKKELDAIIHGQGIQGATIAEWFWRWKSNDLENISRLVRRAAIEELTVAQIAKAAKGTIKNGYADGVFSAPKIDAQRLARTVVNGVSNNARVETIRESSDVIDGVRFVGTLDGRTCPHCAAYDGYIWRGEEMSQARRPPIHPNCRCTLVPYVQLRDEDGKPVDLEGERPAANADFDKLAKDAYNAKAREKGSDRRWDDLSYQTRLKYVYQAQKDFEARTGKKAFERVPASVSFEEYFRRQPESFKRSWLGRKRYEAYANAVANGEDKAELLKIFQPDLGYMQTVKKMRGWAKGYEVEPPTPADPVYQWLEPTFEGATEKNVDSWIKGLEEKEEPELVGLLDDLNVTESLQKTELDKREPKEEDYSDGRKYQKDRKQWVDNSNRLSGFFGKIRDAIKRLVNREQTPPHKDSSGYLTALKIARIERLDHEKVKEEEDKAESWAAVNRDYQTTSVEHENLEIAARKAKKECEKLEKQFREDQILGRVREDERQARNKEIDDARAKQIELERERDDAQRRLRDFGSRHLQEMALHQDRRKKETDKAISRSIETLFPNNGGKTFFSREFRKQIIAVGKKVNCEEEAKQVLEVYDRIGRCYNTGGRKIEEPRVAKTETGYKRNGAFNDINGEVLIASRFNGSDDFYNGRCQFRRTLAHELGHWLEEWALGEDQTESNARWLANEQGSKINPKWKRKKNKKHEVSHKEQPTLCHRLDFYSQTIYPATNTAVYHQPLTSEVFSTAMELICADPETLARQSPKQFDLVMRNLAKLSDGKTSFDPGTYRRPKQSDGDNNG